MVAVIARLQERIHYSIARARYRRTYKRRLCHRHTFFTKNKYKHLNASCEVGCVTYSLLSKGNVSLTSIEIITSLAKIGMRDP